MEDLIFSKHYVDDILDNLQEKLESDFYLDKINIDGKFEIWKQEEKCLVLLMLNQMMVVMVLLFVYHFLLDLMKNGLRNIKNKI